MMAAGRKDNAEAQRTRSFAEQEHEMRLPRGSADFAAVWESDRDGGLGTSLFALLCGREVEVRPGFHRGPAAAVNSGECAVPVRGDGPRSYRGASREGFSGRERPENWRENT